METAAVTRLEPVYRCLGYLDPVTRNGGRRYVIQRRSGEVMVIRAQEMCSTMWLLSLWPDEGYWRAHHRRRVNSLKLDVHGAAARLIRECHAAGVYKGTLPAYHAGAVG